MFCTFCAKNPKERALLPTKGASIFNGSTLTKHVVGNDHQIALKMKDVKLRSDNKRCEEASTAAAASVVRAAFDTVYLWRRKSCHLATKSCL